MNDGFIKPPSYMPTKWDIGAIRKFYADPFENMGMTNGIREAKAASSEHV